MPLNQLAIIVTTICFQFLLSWLFAMVYRRVVGYKADNYDKVDFFVNTNAALSFVSVIISVVLYFFKIIK